MVFASRAVRCLHLKSIRVPRRTHEGLHEAAEQRTRTQPFENTTEQTTPTHRKSRLAPKRAGSHILMFSRTQNQVWGSLGHQFLISRSGIRTLRAKPTGTSPKLRMNSVRFPTGNVCSRLSEWLYRRLQKLGSGGGRPGWSEGHPPGSPWSLRFSFPPPQVFKMSFLSNGRAH